MALGDRRKKGVGKRLPPAGRIGLGNKVFYCKNKKCPHSKKVSDRGLGPIVNTSTESVECPGCNTSHTQKEIRDFPRAADHFVFPYNPVPGTPNLWDILGHECRELPIVFPFHDIDENIEAYYRVWAGGVCVCKGNGLEVLQASPMRVEVRKNGVTSVYNAEGDDLVRNSVVIRPFEWGEYSFAPGDVIPCPGSYQWEEGAQVYPHCASCRRNIRMQFLIAHPDVLNTAGLRHYWIYTTSGAAHDRFFDVLETIRDLSRVSNGLESVAWIVFKVVLTLENTVYRENGIRKTAKKWLMSLVPPPEVVAAMARYASARMIAGVESPPMLPALSEVDEDFPEDLEEIRDEIVEGEYTYDNPPPPPQANNEAATSQVADESPEEESPSSTETTENSLTRPLAPQQVKSALEKKAAKKPELHKTTEATQAQRGLVASKLEECFAPDEDSKDKRHAVLEWLFGSQSVADLTMAQAGALLDWLLDPKSGVEEGYPLHPQVHYEARMIYQLVMREAGQQELPL